MSDIKDFVIDKFDNTTLVKYTGKETDVVIPNSVTRIGSSAFEGCRNLTSITIPNSVTIIDGWAFYNCTGLTSITIPDSVTSIDWDAFRNCTGLTSITIPDSVTSIGEDTFSGCTSLTSITIPDSVTSIGGGAFSDCKSLTSITIPDSVTSIGDRAFEGTSMYNNSANWHNNVLYIGKYLIAAKETLSGVYDIKNDTICVADSAFKNCERLTSVVIPNSVTSIGENAFYNCTGLTNITIPDSVTSIGWGAFKDCSSLTSITIPDSVEIFDISISTYPLYIKNKPLSKITSFDKKLCLFGFVNNEGYKNESKEVIDSYIKYAKSQKKKLYPSILNQKNLLQFMIEYKIIPLADFDLVFDIVKNNIELSALLLEYKNNNFTPQDEMKLFEKELNTNPLSAQELKKVWEVRKNPDGTLCITSYKGSDTEVVVPESIGKSKVTSIDTLAFSPYAGRINSEISNSRKNITQITIPNSVTSISDYAFSRCTGLTSVTIPDSVTSIGDGAFSDCTGLTSIIIPDSVTSIGWDAFRNCTSLTSITIPNSVTSIDYRAFYDCTGLTSVTIPDSVTSIGYRAFHDCTGLTSITIPDSVTSIGKDVFDSIYFQNRSLADIDNKYNKAALLGFAKCADLDSVSDEIKESYIKYAKSQRKRLYQQLLEHPELLRFLTKSKIIPLEEIDLVYEQIKDSVELTAMLMDYKNNNFTLQDEMKLVEKELNKNPLSVQEMKKIWGYRKYDDGTLGITSYKGSDPEVVIPKTIGKSKVTSIGCLAFSPEAGRINSEISNSRKNITQITIPNSVTSIGEDAFYYCESLTNIAIPDSVTSIGDRAFDGCENLTSITIPDRVTRIGWKAFDHCKSLTIYAPANSYAEQYAKKHKIPFIAE